MSGQMFGYRAGRIDVSFRHGDFDLLTMRVRMHGEATAVEMVDDDMKTLEEYVVRKPRRRLSCRISGVFCPFRSFLSWLEAIAVGVYECAVEWDGEGPVGRLEWNHPFLTLRWLDKYGRKDMRLRAEPRQVVGAFYTAFRRFVESREYDPLRYERLRNGEAMAKLSGSRFTEDELIGQLLISTRAEAESKMQSMWPLRVIGEEETESSNWLKPSWEGWDTLQRRRYLKEIFDLVGYGCWGAPIRALRSELVERWLCDR